MQFRNKYLTERLLDFDWNAEYYLFYHSNSVNKALLADIVNLNRDKLWILHGFTVYNDMFKGIFVHFCTDASDSFS